MEIVNKLLELLEKPFVFDEILGMDIKNSVTIYTDDEDIQADYDYYDSMDWDTNDVNIYLANVHYDPVKNIIAAEVYDNSFDVDWLLEVYGPGEVERVYANHYPPEWTEIYHIHLNQTK